MNILDYMYGIEMDGLLGSWKDAMTSRPGVAAYLASAEPVLYDAVAVDTAKL